MTRETFNVDQVTTMNEALQKAPPSKGKLSKGEVLRQLAPTLRELREKKKYTLEGLVTLLATQGLNVKVSTLQGALKRKGTGKGKAAAVPPPPAVPPVTPPPPPASKEATVAPAPAAVKKEKAA